MKHKLVVYLASPMSADTPEEVMRNVDKAMDFGTYLMSQGYVVQMPQLHEFLQAYQENTGQDLEWTHAMWMDYDFELLARCDVLYRLDGESKGADMEGAFAKGRMIEVVYSFTELKTFTMQWERRLEK